MTRSSPPSIRCCSLGLVIALFLVFVAQICNAAYYGKQLGRLSELHHGVSGEIYAVDGRTLFIKGFNYDGEGPAAFFYAGSSKSPGNNGFRVRDERGTTNVLKRYRNKDITLTLPEGKTLNNIKWFSVYCDEFAVNFGDIKIPRSFDYPKPQKLGSLSGIHGVSSEPVVIVDAQTLLIPSFSYDGEAPDAKFWTGAGPHPSPQGIKVPDENGKIQPLRRYDHKTVVLTLPGDLTVHQLGHFGVWCEAFAVDFGHVQIPQSLNVPPSLKMLGVSPQNVRGGQGQKAALSQYQETYISSTPSSSSSSHQQQFGNSLVHQHHRATTYRPILRHDDQVQIVQSVGYRIPKTLELHQDSLGNPYHQAPTPYRQIQQLHQESPRIANDPLLGFNNNNNNLRQLGNVHSGQLILQNYQVPLEQARLRNPSSAQRRIDENQNSRFSSNVQRPREIVSSQFSQPQQTSYSKLDRFPGDQRRDSFIRF
ncbi:protein Skeletor, isoforms B/C isoform X3 [Leptopilina heterotoma]|uniref:protein Skeletor, isoforms B/C isoform X3 n=1 Tax=Leptopilina heterotoma TaxID=63436 RepID=UPI001CA8A7A2|nr:protein Skeletor, isoforms B/C isoform X3 [Leptopilina heterotoma]